MAAGFSLIPPSGGRNFLGILGMWSESVKFATSFKTKGRLHFPWVVSLRVQAAGGNVNNGTNAGASNSNANNAASTTNANYSSPLYFGKEIKATGK